MDRVIEITDALDTAILYGVNNQNMQTLKDLHPEVRIVARGYLVKVSGAEDSIERFANDLHKVEQYCLENNRLTQEIVVQLVKGDKVEGITQQHLILHGVGGKTITARSDNQRRLVKDFEKNDLLFAVGPAGSGKTYTAIALAVKALKNKEVKKIILSRPAVEAGEKLGFLPGDMREKIDPYLQPLYDALQEMIPQAKLHEYLDKGIIEIAPLAFMRGRTLKDAVVILDEAQNTSIPQIKMFMTRLGLNGKMIVTGDLTQVDLPQSQKSGLRDAIEVLDGIEGVSVIHFVEKDIVRHPLVTRIVKAYDKAKQQA